MPVKKDTTKKTKKPSKPAAVVKKKVIQETDVEIKTPTKKPPAEAVAQQPERYWEAVGRRKTAVARVRLFTRGEKGVWVHEKPAIAYFQQESLVSKVEDPLKKMKSYDRFRVTVKVSGGGLSAQAEAVRHGISRALVKFNTDFRKRLKRAGFLTRDPRMKERKKFGLKGARRAPQWAKR